MNPEPDSVDWDTPTRVTGEWVTVDRALSRNDGEVIATIEIRAEGDKPVYVEVADTVPEAWAVTEVGVHPQFVPESYRTARTRFAFADTVAPGETLEVVYGFKVDAEGYLDPPQPPAIEAEEQVEPGEEPSGDLLGSEGGQIFGDNDVPPEFGDLELPDGPEGDAPAAASAAAGDFTRSPSQPPESAEEFRRRLSEAAERTAKATQAAEDTEETEPSEAADSDDESEAADSDDESGAADGDDESGAADGDDDGDGRASSRSRDDDRDRRSRRRRRRRTDRPVVETLAKELERGDADTETLTAIREALGVEGSKRDQVKVNHLQSRVEEFAAYSDSLGDLIDEYGALDEFFEEHVARLDAVEADAARVHDLEDDVAGLRTALDEESRDLSTAIDEAAADRDDLADRLDDLDGRVDAVENLDEDLETVRRELNQLRRQHGDDIDDLSGAIDDLEATLETALGDIERDLEALRAHAKEWTATRKQLADRLAPASLPDLEDA